MREGMYLGAPPVNVGRARAAAVLASMMRGAGAYGASAGAGAPLALPAGLQPGIPTLTQEYSGRLASLYPLSPALFKRDLRRRFVA